MPAPPVRIRSASVPCGQNSTSSSPARNCRSNSVFSPTYDETILRICFVCRRSPRPQSSTPALFDTQVRFFTPSVTSALIRFSGMPQRPKPPTTRVEPSLMSLTASSAEATTLLIMAAGEYQIGQRTADSGQADSGRVLPLSAVRLPLSRRQCRQGTVGCWQQQFVSCELPTAPATRYYGALGAYPVTDTQPLSVCTQIVRKVGG